MVEKKHECISKMLLVHTLTRHSTIQSWNERANLLDPSISSKLLITEQHIVFICHQLFDFIQSIYQSKKDLIVNFDYGRYYGKRDWKTVPIPIDMGLVSFDGVPRSDWISDMPAGVREHGVLFFHLKTDPDLFHVLFKPDVQIGDTYSNTNILYAAGGTKIVKLKSLLFIFRHRKESDDCDIVDIQEVVTFSRPKTIPADQSKHFALRQSVEQKFNDFFNWKKISFKRHPLDAESALLLYQVYEGEKIRNYRMKNCDTSIQRLYACLTFLSSVKKLLESGYWPLDMKSENLCQKHIPHPSCPLTSLAIIDFCAPASSASIYKRSVEPENALKMPINLRQYEQLLTRMNYRGFRNGETVITNLSDRSFGYLVRQMMFEILVNLMNIMYQTSFTRDMHAYFDQFFPADQRVSWTGKLYRRLHFCPDIHHCIYNEFDERIYPLMYWICYWHNIQNSIVKIYYCECTPHGEINDDPIVGGLYTKLFSESAVQEWRQLLCNFRTTPSPFSSNGNPIVELLPV